MPIGIAAEVRDLTGITDVLDLTDATIDKALQYGRGELYAVTFKTDWDTDTSHPLYYKAEMLVHYVAAYWILDRYAGYGDRANLFRDRVTLLSQELKLEYDQYTMINDTSGTTSRFSLVASKYKSYPLNPDADVSAKSTVIIPGD